MLWPAPDHTPSTYERTSLKMTSTERIWMTRQDYTRLHNELAALRSRRNIEVPDNFMDYDANLIAGYRARRARIREIQDLLTNAVVGENPVAARSPNRAWSYHPLRRLRRDRNLPARKAFRRGPDVTVYSTLSPLGHAIAGSCPGERAFTHFPTERTAGDAARGRALRNVRGEIPWPQFATATQR